MHQLENKKTMSRAWTLTSLLLMLLRTEISSLEMISKTEKPTSLSRLESRISIVSNDPEAERRLRDRWNAFVAETAKELDFDLKVQYFITILSFKCYFLNFISQILFKLCLPKCQSLFYLSLFNFLFGLSICRW